MVAREAWSPFDDSACETDVKLLKAKINQFLDAAEKDYPGLLVSLAMKSRMPLQEVKDRVAEQFHTWIDKIRTVGPGAGWSEAQERDELIAELESWVRRFL